MKMDLFVGSNDSVTESKGDYFYRCTKLDDGTTLISLTSEFKEFLNSNNDGDYNNFRNGKPLPDLPKVTGDIVLDGLFKDCNSMKEVDISGIDTTGVISIKHMFSGCSALTRLDLSKWDIRKCVKLKNTVGAIIGCTKLRKLFLPTKGYTTRLSRPKGYTPTVVSGFLHNKEIGFLFAKNEDNWVDLVNTSEFNLEMLNISNKLISIYNHISTGLTIYYGDLTQEFIQSKSPVKSLVQGVPEVVVVTEEENMGKLEVTEQDDHNAYDFYNFRIVMFKDAYRLELKPEFVDAINNCQSYSTWSPKDPLPQFPQLDKFLDITSLFTKIKTDYLNIGNLNMRNVKYASEPFCGSTVISIGDITEWELPNLVSRDNIFRKSAVLCAKGADSHFSIKGTELEKVITDKQLEWQNLGERIVDESKYNWSDYYMLLPASNLSRRDPSYLTKDPKLKERELVEIDNQKNDLNIHVKLGLRYEFVCALEKLKNYKDWVVGDPLPPLPTKEQLKTEDVLCNYIHDGVLYTYAPTFNYHLYNFIRDRNIVLSIERMFENTLIEYANVSKWDISEVDYVDKLFEDSDLKFVGDISHWYKYNGYLDLRSMFNGSVIVTAGISHSLELNKLLKEQGVNRNGHDPYKKRRYYSNYRHRAEYRPIYPYSIYYDRNLLVEFIPGLYTKMDRYNKQAHENDYTLNNAVLYNIEGGRGAVRFLYQLTDSSRIRIDYTTCRSQEHTNYKYGDIVIVNTAMRKLWDVPKPPEKPAEPVMEEEIHKISSYARQRYEDELGITWRWFHQYSDIEGNSSHYRPVQNGRYMRDWAYTAEMYRMRRRDLYKAAESRQEQRRQDYVEEDRKARGEEQMCRNLNAKHAKRMSYD